MRYLILAALAAATFARGALACSCIRIVPDSSWPKLANGDPAPSLEELQTQNDLIVAGEVLSVTRNGDRASLESKIGPADVELLVSDTWMGEPRKIVVVHTSWLGACGFAFEKGKRYLVFANNVRQQLTTSTCTRTAELSNSEELVGIVTQLLGPPKTAKIRQPNSR